MVAQLKGVGVYVVLCLCVALAAIGIEHWTGLTGPLLLVLFIAAPIILDIATGLAGKPSQVGMLVFQSAAIGVPALVIYWALRACG